MTVCMTPSRPEPAAQALAGELRYSRVWEDHALLEHGLAVTPKDEAPAPAPIPSR